MVSRTAGAAEKGTVVIATEGKEVEIATTVVAAEIARHG
jgi:hypothetical protein